MVGMFVCCVFARAKSLPIIFLVIHYLIPKSLAVCFKLSCSMDIREMFAPTRMDIYPIVLWQF
jgi:hypothetical protein